MNALVENSLKRPAPGCCHEHTTRLPTSGQAIPLEPSVFSLTTTGEPVADSGTTVELRYDPTRTALVIDFVCDRDPYVDQNNYTVDNTDMWNQEVFEIFISPGPEVPTRYVEIELNPNGALYSSWVLNRDGKGDPLEHEMFDGHERGIETAATKSDRSWRGQIVLPLEILGGSQIEYRYNLFRVVSDESHDPAQKWACTPATCSFLAWSPTFSGSMPNFHIPACFGHLFLERSTDKP